MEIKRVGIFSAAKVGAVIYGCIAIIPALVFLCIGLTSLPGILSDAATPFDEVDAFLYACFCLLPFFYGVIGFVGGAVIAVVYNLMARTIGGLEFDVEYKNGAADGFVGKAQ